MKQPIKLPTVRAIKRKENYVSGMPMSSERYGIIGPMLLISDPQMKRVKQ